MQEQLYNILSASIKFCHEFEKKYYTFLKQAGFKQRIRKSKMELAELLTLQIWFHFSGYKNFKIYYNEYVRRHMGDYFFLVSYPQVNKMINEIPFLLDLFLKARLNKTQKVHFIDASSLAVCHLSRANRNKIFPKEASLGYSTIHGHFFGFKLHLIINSRGEIANYVLASAKHHDSKFMVQLSKGLEGKLCGDKAYISDRKRQKLAQQNLKVLTHARKDMRYKNVFHGVEKYLMRNRNLIESTFNKLKSVLQIQTNRSRSVCGFMANCLAALLAYTFDTRKPAITLP